MAYDSLKAEGVNKRLLSWITAAALAFTAVLLAGMPAQAAASPLSKPTVGSSITLGRATPTRVTPRPANGAPAVQHVWYIMLENSSFEENFGASVQNDPRTRYLAKTLPSGGALLQNYYGIAHPSTSNWIGAISGQPPSFGYAPSPWSNQWDPCDEGYGVHFCLGTQLNCPAFVPFQNVWSVRGSTPARFRTTVNGVLTGQQGCVYPQQIETVVDQLETQGLTWKAYMQGMSGNCQHPALNSVDPTSLNLTQNIYETGENPFMYFRSVIDDVASCQQNDVPLGSVSNPAVPGLARDLSSAATTPNFSFIGLTMCDLGHNLCAQGPTGPTAPCPIVAGVRDNACLGQATRKLAQLVPAIQNSPAYRQGNGLIIINWDEASYFVGDKYADDRSSNNEINQLGASGSPNDTRFGFRNGMCYPGHLGGAAGAALQWYANHEDGISPTFSCNQPATVNPGDPGPGGDSTHNSGGGNTGAILLSPCITAGTVSPTAYNHFSMLRTIDDIFGLPHLGYASDQSPNMRSLGTDVFSRCRSATPPTPTTSSGKLLIKSRSLTVQGDGIVVTTSCTAPIGRQCNGRITLKSNPPDARDRFILGRRDLSQRGGTTQAVTVYLSTRGMNYIHQGRVIPAIAATQVTTGTGFSAPQTVTLPIRANPGSRG